MALRIESDGGRDRRLSLGAVRHGDAASGGIGVILKCHDRSACRRRVVIQSHGIEICGCGVMSDVVVQANRVSKEYRINRFQRKKTHERSLRDDVVGWLTSPFRKRDDSGSLDSIWALKDVSFDVKAGEVVGIIGRNGAGKSTLLKILSRITRPTEGTIDIYGRVGSLLEVGTGFHAELSGRENIYLNGAILGMGKREIDRKFDEIVAFSEVENLLIRPSNAIQAVCICGSPLLWRHISILKF